jgi:hypothetical protein
MIIIWGQSNSPSQTTYGSDLSADDLQFEKEYWKPRTTFRYATSDRALCRSRAERALQLHDHASL